VETGITQNVCAIKVLSDGEQFTLMGAHETDVEGVLLGKDADSESRCETSGRQAAIAGPALRAKLRNVDSERY